MSKTIAYLRTSTNQQDVNHQKLEILEFARHRDLKTDDFVEVIVSSRHNTKQRRADELVAKLSDSDTLVVTEL